MTIQARLDRLELEIGSTIDAQSGKATWADIDRRGNQLSSTSDGRTVTTPRNFCVGFF